MVRITVFLLALMCSHSDAIAIDTRLRGRSSYALKAVSGEETCSDLINKGQYFATKVAIGTPVGDEKQQEFELVADTGSDSIIVTSCVCVQNKMCDPKDKCYTGTKKSSTFQVKEMPVKKKKSDTSKEEKKAPLGIAMTFGSGTVMSIIASDNVQVAGQKARMDDGLLLMVDRRMLNIQGTFQGILGLGPPDMENKTMAPVNKDHKKKSWGKEVKGQSYAPKLFMQEAGIQRYSLCFNDGGNPGTMRLNVQPFKQYLPTVGTFHWGLGLFGVSVGSSSISGGSTKEPFVCGTDAMKDGMTSPCGAIPDSGTTLLMGPKDHIIKMFSALCDDWDRCKDAIENEKFGVKKDENKSDAFQKVLYACNEWKTPEKGINEVPSVFFTVGQPDKQQRLELTPWAYITETKQALYEHHKKYLMGVIPVDAPTPTGEFKDVCVPSFGAQQYNTKDNGPVWIMGHPLFYQFHVGYNLGKHSKVPGASGDMAMSFTSGKCSTCSDGKTSLLSSDDELYRNQVRPTRKSESPPHVKYYDTTLPM